jgi:hypothetical protein
MTKSFNFPISLGIVVLVYFEEEEFGCIFIKTKDLQICLQRIFCSGMLIRRLTL